MYRISPGKTFQQVSLIVYSRYNTYPGSICRRPLSNTRIVPSGYRGGLHVSPAARSWYRQPVLWRESFAIYILFHIVFLYVNDRSGGLF
jgi:hypothetical protein